MVLLIACTKPAEFLKTRHRFGHQHINKHVQSQASSWKPYGFSIYHLLVESINNLFGVHERSKTM